MKLTKHKRETLMMMNMTPMIDIAFLLIIFFITVSQVSEINKAAIELAKQEGSDEQREGAVTINVTKDGEVIVSGNTISVTELMAIVDKEIRAVGNDPYRVKVAIRADRRGNCERVNEIVAALARLQVMKVNIRVEVPK